MPVTTTARLSSRSRCGVSMVVWLPYAGAAGGDCLATVPGAGAAVGAAVAGATAVAADWLAWLTDGLLGFGIGSRRRR